MPPTKTTHKLNLTQRQYLVQLLARYPHEPRRVADLLAQAVGITLAPGGIVTFAQRHEAEIQEAREAWLGKVTTPVTQPEDRVRELIALLEIQARGIFTVRCAACVGLGKVETALTKDDKALLPEGTKSKPALCSACRGEGRILDPEAAILLAQLKLAGAPLLPSRLLEVQGLIERLPLGLPGERLEEFQSLLANIRAELGDAWSPKERGIAPDGPQVPGQQQTVVVLAGNTQEYVARLRALRASLAPSPSADVVVPGSGNGNPS